MYEFLSVSIKVNCKDFLFLLIKLIPNRKYVLSCVTMKIVANDYVLIIGMARYIF